MRDNPAAYLPLATRLVIGFLAGALAVPTFHHAMIALLGAAGMIQPNLYSMRPIAPFGVPQILSQAFWGGLWGLLFTAVFTLRRDAKLLLMAVVFGAVALPLAGWFVVAPIKGQPIAAGWNTTRMMASVFINGAWGLGLGVFLVLAVRLIVRPSSGIRRSP